MTEPTRPILVVMVWRGGERFQRCLDSIVAAHGHFRRVLISVTAPYDSDDMVRAKHFASHHPWAEVICTGVEMPTMQHQAFWIDHLRASGANRRDWVFWLAYDDQIRLRGIEAIVDTEGGWPLQPDTTYIGPWALRHESPDVTFNGPWDAALESWTSFPADGPLRLPLLDWITLQLEQPTYIQMSGLVAPLDSFVALNVGRPRKTGPMRIEMAVAAAPPTTYVQEFPEPTTIIYGRSNSDRASYGRRARKEDLHLAAWLVQYARRNPSEWTSLVRMARRVASAQIAVALRRRPSPEEEWRVRNVVQP